MVRTAKTKDTVSMEIPVELVSYFQNYYKASTARTAVIMALEHSKMLDLRSLEEALSTRSDCLIVDGMTQYQLCLFSRMRDWRSVVSELITNYLTKSYKERKQLSTINKNNEKTSNI